MNLRIGKEKERRKEYLYVVFYNIYTGDSPHHGTGWTTVKHYRPIDSEEQLAKMMIGLQTDINKKETSAFRSNIRLALTGYKLLKETGDIDDTKCRKEESSSENDPEIPKGT